MPTRTRIIIVAAIVVCVALVLLVYKMNRTQQSNESARTDSPPLVSVGDTPKTIPNNANTASPDPSPTMPQVPTVAATSTPAASSSPSKSAMSAPSSVLQNTKLLIPVVGIRPEQLQDTFTAARSQGRVHNAIDIMAAHNTPVVACADGRIVKFFQSERGGTTIYQIGTDDRTVFYYAHLDHYADSITENYFAHRGETIAYVGDTGNAGAGNYHLHFAIWIVSDPKHFWNGEDINPYPLLRN